MEHPAREFVAQVFSDLRPSLASKTDYEYTRLQSTRNKLQCVFR